MNINPNPIRVFVADDHPMVLAGLTHLFQRRSNFQLLGTSDSYGSLFQQLRTARPQALILDLNMPGMDFTHAVDQLREEFPWLKIIAYTQYQDADLIRGLRKRGIHGFLNKSVSSDRICEVVRSIVTLGKKEFPNPASVQVAIASVEDNPALADDFKKRLNLSRREQQIVMLISRGLTSARISAELFISKHTVETHRKNILRKLDLNSSKELVRFAVIQGLAS